MTNCHRTFLLYLEFGRRMLFVVAKPCATKGNNVSVSSCFCDGGLHCILNGEKNVALFSKKYFFGLFKLNFCLNEEENEVSYGWLG